MRVGRKRQIQRREQIERFLCIKHDSIRFGLRLDQHIMHVYPFFSLPLLGQCRTPSCCRKHTLDHSEFLQAHKVLFHDYLKPRGFTMIQYFNI
jgi:hypothetical protein